MNTEPTPFNTDPAGEAEQLIELARRIRAHQQSHSRPPTDAAWVRRHPGLGSTKTYIRLVAGDASQLILPRWLSDYRAIAATLDATSRDLAEEEIYDDLAPALALRAALTSAMNDRSVRRFIMMLGEPGAGKTSAARAAARRFGKRVVLAECDETWKDSVGALLDGLLDALGIGHRPASLNGRLGAIVAALNHSRTALVIDEAHHLGPRGLNIIKTILNRTPGEVVGICLPTLWSRIETSAYHEARQLTTNRMHERILLESIDHADVRTLIERRCPSLDDVVTAAAVVTPDATRHGGFSWIAAACREANRLAGSDPVDIDTFARGAQRAASLRGHNTTR